MPFSLIVSCYNIQLSNPLIGFILGFYMYKREVLLAKEMVEVAKSRER